MTTIPTNPTVDAVVRTAQSLPDLVGKLEQFDPALADSLKAKTLASSKSAPVTALAGLVGFAASYYGLNWDPAFCAGVATVLTLVAGYGMRLVTKTRIAGVFTTPKAPATATIPDVVMKPPAS